MSEHISIVFSSDENYKYPLMLSIFSALVNKNESSVYDFVILVPNEFSEKTKETIKELLKSYNNVNLSFINMEDKYANANINAQHITKPTYYRLSLPELLQVDKCLYLDVDIIVCRDLSELYNTDLKENYIAGVKAAGYFSKTESIEKKAEMLEIDNINTYVNAGVLLMNLDRMRKDSLTQIFDELVENNYKDQDQDIINKVCFGRTIVLPPKYNSMTKYNNSRTEFYFSDDLMGLRNSYNPEEWMEACTDPVIIHYADKIKPWNSFETDFSYIWWQYALKLNQKVDCIDEILLNINRKGLEKKSYDQAQLKLLNEKIKRLSEINPDADMLTEKYRESEANLNTAKALLKQAGDENNKLLKMLQKSYDEKAELKKVLQRTYDEKYERGVRIRELEKEVEKQKNKKNEYNGLLKETKESLEHSQATVKELRLENKSLLSVSEKMRSKNDELSKKNNNLRLENEKQKNTNTKLENDIRNLKSSFSFKLGRFLTWLPRKAKRLIKKK